MAGECLNMVFLLQEISANCSFQKENDDDSNKKCDPNKSDWMAGECLNMVFLLQEISANCSFQKENDDEAVDGHQVPIQ